MPKLGRDLNLVGLQVYEHFGVPTLPTKAAGAKFLFYTVNVPLYEYVPLYEIVPLYELHFLYWRRALEARRAEKQRVLTKEKKIEFGKMC